MFRELLLIFLMRDYANSTVLLVTLFARNVRRIFRGVISAQFRLVISAGNSSAYVQVRRVLRWLESSRKTSPYYSRKVEFDTLLMNTPNINDTYRRYFYFTVFKNA